jgi:hypothetical protein
MKQQEWLDKFSKIELDDRVNQIKELMNIISRHDHDIFLVQSVT